MLGKRGSARILVAAATPLVCAAWLAYMLRESPLAVVMDLVVVGMILSASGLAASTVALRIAVATERARLLGSAARVVGVAGLVVLGLLASFRASGYTATDVRIAGRDAVLAGTLYRPRGNGPFPGAVLVHGSGPEARDEYAFYARYLARRGIASLAYDKRGVGESTGQLYDGGYRAYADDALAAVRTLGMAPGVAEAKVGLVGFSEAEWVAPLAAARSDGVAFVVVIGASGMTPAEQGGAEIEIRLRNRGYGDSVIREALVLNERVLEYQRTGVAENGLRTSLRRAQAEPWFTAAEDLPSRLARADDNVWWRSVMDFDPAPVWERVRVPVLLVKGGRDEHSSAETMRSRIAPALERGGNVQAEVRVFPNADHLLLEWPRGSGTPPPRFAPGYPELVVEWITRNVSDQRRRVGR